VAPALPSHGRSHRFDPCHAHFAFPQASRCMADRSSAGLPRIVGLGTCLGHGGEVLLDDDQHGVHKEEPEDQEFDAD
jgi:hypothetical protein